MATRDDILADVKNLIGTDEHASDAEITTHIQFRFSSLYENFGWGRRRRDFVISTVAQVVSTDADLVTVTQGSPLVTSAGTPFTSAMDGRQVAIANEVQYFFLAFVDTATITLQDGEGNSVDWPGESDTEASWRIFKTLYPLPADAEGVETLVGQWPMEEYDGGRIALDQIDPYRLGTNSDPMYWMYVGEDSSNRRELEIYPVPTAARLLRGQYLKGAPTLAADTVIPIPRAFLGYFVAADVLNMLHAKTGDPSYKDLALFYERKGKEEEPYVHLVELERLSLPATLGRTYKRPRSMGAGWYVDHQIGEE